MQRIWPALLLSAVVASAVGLTFVPVQENGSPGLAEPRIKYFGGPAAVAQQNRGRPRGEPQRSYDPQDETQAVVIRGEPRVEGPFVLPPVVPASLDRDLRSLPRVRPRDKRPRREMPRLFKPRGLPGREPELADPVAQTWPGIVSMPAPLLTFEGMNFLDWGAGWPPDTNGDVGPDHYIQTVNTSIAIFTKTGAITTGPFTFDTFFEGTGTPCDYYNRGDPIVLYDRVSGRWLITDSSWISSSGPFYECIAVSKTPDPVSGGWWMYALQAHPSALNDYPKLGVWRDGIYMSVNLFNLMVNPAQFVGARVWALNRDDLISGSPLRTVAFDISLDAGLLPANFQGAPPPSGSPAPFLDLELNAVDLWRFHVDWSIPAHSTFVGPSRLPVAGFSFLSSLIPQPGTAQGLDPIDDRLMMQAQYRRIGDTESLWVNHTVSNAGRAAIRWYELRDPNGIPTVHQQGTWAAGTEHRWMGSLAVDGYGNMALGYSISSNSVYPGLRYVGRLAGDTLGTTPQAETTLVDGMGSQTSYNRWGDYSAMNVDPSDDCTFWYTQQYYQANGTDWRTRIGSFRFPGCHSAPAILSVNPPSGPVAGGTTIALTGTNFVAGATTVTVGGIAAANVSVASTTALTAVVPAGTPGAATVAVTTAGGTGTYAAGFTYTGTGPTITLISPGSGPYSGDALVTITGSGFGAGTTVDFGANAGRFPVVTGSTRIDLITPPGPIGPVDVTVRTLGGWVTAPNGYTYTGSPPPLPGDLVLQKTHIGDFTVGAPGVYTLTVSNAGPGTVAGPVTIVDDLPSGLTFQSADGTGWVCLAEGPVVRCVHPGSVSPAASLPSLRLTVAVGSAAVPGVVNNARVFGENDAGDPVNNRASDPTVVAAAPAPSPQAEAAARPAGR